MSSSSPGSLLATIETERLSLRPATDDDVDALWTLWTNADVRRYLWDDREISRDEAATTLSDCRALTPSGLGLWMLELRGGGILGCAALLPVTTAAEFEPGIAGMVEPLVALFPDAWGNGFAVEALCVIRDYGTHQLGLSRIAGVTDVPNVASDRMLRRAGFRELGECEGPKHRLRTYIYDAAAVSEERRTTRL